MKIVISDLPPYFLDLDAPTLPAYEMDVAGITVWWVWCVHCDDWHDHGAGEGHRIAHCRRGDSPYHEHGYNLAYAGPLDTPRDGKPRTLSRTSATAVTRPAAKTLTPPCA
jgi:hypothetical protein